MTTRTGTTYAGGRVSQWTITETARNRYEIAVDGAVVCVGGPAVVRNFLSAQ